MLYYRYTISKNDINIR